MAATNSRPLSPHLTIWRWGPHMVVSILHRVTGVALSIVGPGHSGLVAAGAGARGGGLRALRRSSGRARIGLFVLIGLTWAFFQHLLSGIRHLVMDTGAALRAATPTSVFAILTIVGSLVLTAALLGLHPGSAAQ